MNFELVYKRIYLRRKTCIVRIWSCTL